MSEVSALAALRTFTSTPLPVMPCDESLRTRRHKSISSCRAAQVTQPSDDRSALARAYAWASRIMVVSLEMVLPGLAGHWIDQQLGTVALFLLLGLIVGGVAASVHLLHMLRSNGQK